jgi:hypothetical protein
MKIERQPVVYIRGTRTEIAVTVLALLTFATVALIAAILLWPVR